MRLLKLTLINFRNYERLEFEPSEGLNIILGANAQGKTNLVESIYMLSTTRPIRANKDTELIRFNAESASMRGIALRDNGLEIDLEIVLSKSFRKQAFINTVKQSRYLELLGYFNTVVFSAQDLAIVRGEPADRRRFIDLEIAQIKPGYAMTMAKYKRIIEQRNELLRRHAEGKGALAGLDAWNEQMIEYGSSIITERRLFIDEIAEPSATAHARLTDNAERLQLRYLPNIPFDDDVKSAFADAMQQNLSMEIRRGGTLIGPQRDDLSIAIDGNETKTYGSQGQQRTAALSLKLAEVELLAQKVGEFPVVLLDDVMSDLDDQRKAQVMGFLLGKAQVFITCAELHSFSEMLLNNARIFNIVNGNVVAEV